MFKYLLEGSDINWMAIFALVTFFTLFAIILYTTFKSKPAYIQHMANLPLEEDSPASQNHKNESPS